MMLALVLAAALTPIGGAPATCPRTPPGIAHWSNFEMPDGAHPTHARVRFLVDVGSDGRVRRSALVESSGDAAVDAAATDAIGRFRYSAPSIACVAASFATAQFWDFAPDATATPAPKPGPAIVCAAPFVRPKSMRPPAHRQPAGTAAVDVALDASARVKGVQLVTSSGNKKADYAAAVAARNGTYAFVEQPGCAPHATTYQLELTFR